MTTEKNKQQRQTREKNDENWMIEDDFRRENSAHDARAELCATRARKKKKKTVNPTRFHERNSVAAFQIEIAVN